jgi:chorismate mutase/prephenate dehydratase
MSDHEPLRPTLAEIRSQIDAIDRQLLDLLRRRTELAQEVGKLKQSDGKPFFTPERERQIYDQLQQTNLHPLRKEHAIAIFREIISAARACERQITVAYWGPEGTYTHLAAVQAFGRSTLLQPHASIEDVFRAVELNHADYGVVPIENSLNGVVPETLDMFPQTNARICAETVLPVQHNLLSTANSLDEIQRVYAAPQPYNQCRKWLRANLPNVEVVDVAPTSRAAQHAQNDPAGAAIANQLCAEIYGLNALAESIQDDPRNHTRFVVIGYNEPAPSGHDKTTLMFSLRNRPGQLYRVLGVFNEYEVNLTMIESRPAQRVSFEYIFYVDCAGHHTEPRLANAIREISDVALETTLLGSYPSNDPKLATS